MPAVCHAGDGFVSHGAHILSGGKKITKQYAVVRWWRAAWRKFAGWGCGRSWQHEVLRKSGWLTGHLSWRWEKASRSPAVLWGRALGRRGSYKTSDADALLLCLRKARPYVRRGGRKGWSHQGQPYKPSRAVSNITLCHLDWTEVKIRTKPNQKHDFEYWIKMDFCGRFKVLGSVRTSSSNTDRNSLSLSSAWSWVTRKEVTDTVTWRSWSSTTVYQARPCPSVLPASIHTDSRLKGDWSSPIRTAPLCMMVTSLLRGVPGDSTHLPVYQLHPFSVPHLVLPSLPECEGLRFMLTFPCLCPPDTVRTGNCFSKD